MVASVRRVTGQAPSVLPPVLVSACPGWNDCAVGEEASAVAIMVMNFEVDDFDAWKELFDSDPVGRAASGAVSHVVSRAVENANEGFVRVEFPTTEQATAFREKLLASGALERGGMRLKTGPTVAEVVDQQTY
jgi:hypothetical protein